MDKSNTSGNSYLFQVEIKISASTNAAALKHLLRVLENGDFKEYKIGSDIQSAATVEKAPKDTSKKAAAKSPPAAGPLENRLNAYIDSKRLIRLKINKGRGVKLNIPCRVLNYDTNLQLLTVYHVDEKQVYTFKLTEIDDFIE